VIVINDRHATQHIVAQAHAARPELYILARTHYIGELDVLCGLGARQVISEEFESAIEIFAHVLHEFAIPDNIVQAEIMYVRSGRYAMLRGSGAAAPPDLMRLLERAATQTYYLDEGTPAVGRTLREINLRAASGATVIAVVRGGQPVTNPPPDFRFEQGDVLVLVGTHRQVEAAKALLSGAAVPVTRPE
jgi:CPA2 family monovalent cation:H+ antiporter-2